MDAATLITVARRRAGLSQRQLASRAGTSPAAVCFYESGERIPRVDTLARLIAATGATLHIEATVPAVDVAANGAALIEVLDLADHLPQRRERRLTAPVFARLARRG